MHVVCSYTGLPMYIQSPEEVADPSELGSEVLVGHLAH